MIVSAKDAGADLVKFQLFDADADKGKPHYDWAKSHELTYDQAKMLFDYGEEVGIEVFFSVFGVEYVEWCERIGVKRYKIAAGMRDKVTLDAVSRTNKRVICSEVTEKEFPASWSWLYCPPNYPQTFVGYLSFPYFRRSYFDGFSDHTPGIEVAKIAIARGASIIEKHFVLEHNPDYPDDAWSMTPEDLRELVRWERVCKEAL